MTSVFNRPIAKISNILIIDDNESITTLLSRFLTMKGIKYTISSTGQNGLNLIRQNSYDVILLDLTMPSFSGYDVIDSLEKDETLKTNNIFLFTASHISPLDESELLKRGILCCIKKPTRIDELLKIIGIE